MEIIFFQYEGHKVNVITKLDRKGRPRYWVYIDSRPVFFSNKPDTAKRLATRFIDVLSDTDFLTQRQGKTTHLTDH